MGKSVTSKSQKKSPSSVYTTKEEEWLLRLAILIYSLHIDEETGEPLCEICGELLSSSVEDDYPIKCKTCGLNVIAFIYHSF